MTRALTDELTRREEYAEIARTAAKNYLDGIEAHRKLEREPRLYTRSEVVKYMQLAITMSQLGGKLPTDEELDNLIT